MRKLRRSTTRRSSRTARMQCWSPRTTLVCSTLPRSGTRPRRSTTSRCVGVQVAQYCATRTLSPVVAGAQVVYSKEFPLSVDELLPIAEVMSRTQRHWVNFERFLKTKMPEGAWRPRRARHTHSRPQGAWVLCYVRACCVHDCRCRLPGDVQHPSVPDDSCGYVCGM